MSFELNEQKRRVAATFNLASAGYDQEAVRFFPTLRQSPCRVDCLFGRHAGGRHGRYQA